MKLGGDSSRVALQNESGAQTRAAASRLRADNPIEQKLPRPLWGNATGSKGALADGQPCGVHLPKAEIKQGLTLAHRIFRRAHRDFSSIYKQNYK